MSGLKVKGNWIAWELITIKELKVQMALGVLTKKGLQDALYSKMLTDEVTGWLFKHLENLKYSKNSEYPKNRVVQDTQEDKSEKRRAALKNWHLNKCTKNPYLID